LCNAVSVAGILMTTDSLIGTIPEKAPVNPYPMY